MQIFRTIYISSIQVKSTVFEDNVCTIVQTWNEHNISNWTHVQSKMAYQESAELSRGPCKLKHCPAKQGPFRVLGRGEGEWKNGAILIGSAVSVIKITAHYILF